MAYHQKVFAPVKPGSRARASSQTRGAWTSAADCFQNWTSLSERSNQPLPTMPCTAGSVPVSIVACAAHVTAGTGATIVRTPPTLLAKSRSLGAPAPSSDGESPTTLRTATRCITTPRRGAARRG